MAIKVLAMQAAGGDPVIEYSALDMRALLDGILTEGVTTPGGLKCSQRAAGANFSVDIAAGFAAIAGDDTANQGKYLFQSTAVENRVVPSPPGSGTRTHRVIARIRDKLHQASWTSYDGDVEVLEDTGGGVPAIPASAISLATVSVTAGQTSVQDGHITHTRPYAAAPPGGVLVAPTAVDLPFAPYDGQEVYQRDVKTRRLYDSAAAAYRDIPFGAWTSYTPTLTASTSNPTLGTGSTRIGAYLRIGQLVFVRAAIIFGTSGAAAGGGTYRVSLPVTAKTLSAGYHLGSSQVYDSSANNADSGVARIGAGSGWGVMEFLAAGSLATNSVPWTWSNGDAIYLSMFYEAA